MLRLPGRGQVFVRYSGLSDSGSGSGPGVRHSGLSGSGTGSDSGTSTSTGVPVLLLHAWTLSLDVNYFGVMPELAARHPFVGLDQRGHRRGLRITGPFSIADCADDVVAVLDALEIERVVICGYSLGGPVGMSLALAHPDRVAGMVLAATALNYRQWWRDRMAWRPLRVTGPAAWLRLGSSISARYFGVNRRNTPTLAPRWPWVQRELARTPFASAVAMGSAVSRYDLRGRVGPLRDIPSAAIVATRDTLCLPRWQYGLADELGATMFPLDADHDLPVSRPEDYAAVVFEALDHVQRRIAGPG